MMNTSCVIVRSITYSHTGDRVRALLVRRAALVAAQVEALAARQLAPALAGRFFAAGGAAREALQVRAVLFRAFGVALFARAVGVLACARGDRVLRALASTASTRRQEDAETCRSRRFWRRTPASSSRRPSRRPSRVRRNVVASPATCRRSPRWRLLLRRGCDASCCKRVQPVCCALRPKSASVS